jgi:hypothetical protein
MKVLLDENFPLALIRDFSGHDCFHVITVGWAGTKNGELLAKAEQAGFDVLITFDHGIPKDHVISARKIAVYVVRPSGQGIPATRALLPEILIALQTCKPGQTVTFTNRKTEQS